MFEDQCLSGVGHIHDLEIRSPANYLAVVSPYYHPLKLSSLPHPHKDNVRAIKEETARTMEAVLEGLHRHEKETRSQMLDFDQQMRRRFEDASSKLNEQHKSEVATHIHTCMHTHTLSLTLSNTL